MTLVDNISWHKMLKNDTTNPWVQYGHCKDSWGKTGIEKGMSQECLTSARDSLFLTETAKHSLPRSTWPCMFLLDECLYFISWDILDFTVITVHLQLTQPGAIQPYLSSLKVKGGLFSVIWLCNSSLLQAPTIVPLKSQPFSRPHSLTCKHFRTEQEKRGGRGGEVRVGFEVLEEGL